LVDTVLVSGGSGYIAGYLIRQLVAEGWRVRATIRNLAREASVRKLLAVDDSRLSFFPADLNHDAGWQQAMAGCSHVAHVASPLSAKGVKDANELIVPARDGVLRALRAAKAVGVMRFVMTSSVAAIAYGQPKRVYPFTEADWTDVKSAQSYPYVQSKTIAERAARDWMAAEGGSIEFCTVNPAMVIGPVWGDDFSPSIEVVRKLLQGSYPACPDLGWGIVDVRDVADLHVRALTAPGMAGERFIASGPFLKMIDIARILKERLGLEANKVPTRKAPDFLVRLLALFDPVARQVVGELGKVKIMDAGHAKTVLDWVARASEDSIVDTARSLIDLGIVIV
jgi:dihydroflavonol-4-reductase